MSIATSSAPLKNEWWRIARLALPVTLQSIVMASLEIVDQVMVGQLGDLAIGAVGASLKAVMPIGLLLSSWVTGLSIFAAQYWGKGARHAYRRLVELGLGVAVLVGVILATIFYLGATPIMSVFTRDFLLIATSAKFTRILCWSYIPLAVSQSLSALLRSREVTILPTAVSITAAFVNILLDYLLIFGIGPVQAMGVKGAALGTVLARSFEAALLSGIWFYHLQGLRAAIQERDRDEMVPVRRELSRILRRSAPILGGGLQWVLGEQAYAAIFGRISRTDFAAFAATSSAMSLSTALMSGLAAAGAVLIGQSIGAGHLQATMKLARHLLRASFVGGLITGLVLFAVRSSYLSLMDLSPEATAIAHGVLGVFAVMLWCKVCNMVLSRGILIAGGDSGFVFKMDLSTTWLIGVPMAIIGGLVLGIPLPAVYFLVCLEELVRLIIGVRRFNSRAWMERVV